MKRIFWLFLVVAFPCLAEHYPIQFSIPESKIVKEVPQKERDFAFITPLNRNTYVYRLEEDYYGDYQRSYFAVTCKKGGWDCMRHYEILANGCIPYFIDLDECPDYTMYFFPKELIEEAMHLPGVHYESLSIDHTIFDHAKYQELAAKLLEYTRTYLTTRAMAQYLLKAVGYTDSKPILFLSRETSADYLRCLSLIGLKELLGGKIVDFPKIPHIYKDYKGDPLYLYGRGFSYSKIVEPDDVDRSSIVAKIRGREFGLIIFGSLHRGMPLLGIVQKYYSPEEIVYLCGEDTHPCLAMPPSARVFLREFDCLKSAGSPTIVLPASF